jgi:hypothetical protein
MIEFIGKMFFGRRGTSSSATMAGQVSTSKPLRKSNSTVQTD